MLNRTMKSRRKLPAAFILLAPTIGFAQVDTSNWECESCPFDEGYRAELEVGATEVSDDSVRFGNFTGYGEKGTYANVDGQGRYVGEEYRADWYIEDLGLDSRVVELSTHEEQSRSDRGTRHRQDSHC